ncbi:Laminin subunit alpha-2 precursor [Helicobacter cetorum]|uniref:Laminin subunit alpha-2 precursor n=1 Tax=Helicobacter cetorum TaxID=138563 RepID=UPI000CF04170|nr:Laminin subunit alpha-2 precursor [Helicobacter cetorum]
MPKIHNYSQNLVARSYHNKQPKIAVENNQKELTNSLETAPTNELAQHIKSDNIAIGNLQKRLKDLTSMHKDIEELISLSKDYSQNQADDFDEVKNHLNKTYQAFSQIPLENHYISELQAPSNIEMDNSQALRDFSQNLQTERESIQNALNQWKKELSKAISSTKYDTLDKNSLNFEKFQNAHNIEKITPSRLQELLA